MNKTIIVHVLIFMSCCALTQGQKIIDVNIEPTLIIEKMEVII
jgi:hypothetical protein